MPNVIETYIILVRCNTPGFRDTLEFLLSLPRERCYKFGWCRRLFLIASRNPKGTWKSVKSNVC